MACVELGKNISLALSNLNKKEEEIARLEEKYANATTAMKDVTRKLGEAESALTETKGTAETLATAIEEEEAREKVQELERRTKGGIKVGFLEWCFGWMAGTGADDNAALQVRNMDLIEKVGQLENSVRACNEKKLLGKKISIFLISDEYKLLFFQTSGRSI
mmetsp:Transcript_21968/g.50080  ORF Transcript_21968/g.50080 Transcript_21968/m.50080 type:complete len:162 (-) Transcript_21968:1037-1522(-)